MTKNQMNYYTKKVFEPEECDDIIQWAKELEGQDSVTLNTGNTLIRRSKQAWIEASDDTRWIYDRVIATMVGLNDAHYGFDIDDMEMMQFTEYGWLGWYAPHYDSAHPKVRNRKLTMSVELSDPNDCIGGGLKLWSANSPRVPERERGRGIIFPSHMLHSARPVLWGKRNALVCWMRGPDLR